MRKSEYTKLLAGLLFCASLVLSAVPAGAQIVVANPEGTKHNIKTFMNNIKESKFVLDTTAFINKTSSTLGDAKRSVTEYVVKNKEKLEKKLKKVEKYKKKAEEYKKDYEEYKKWADENIAEAKRMKELAEEKYKEAQQMKSDITDGINTAKQIAGQAGDTVSGLKDVAQSKTGSAAGKVGINTGGSSSGEDISTGGNANTGGIVNGNYSAAASEGIAAPATSSAVSVASGRLPFTDSQTPANGTANSDVPLRTDQSPANTSVAGNSDGNAVSNGSVGTGGTNPPTANIAASESSAKAETLDDKIIKYGKELSEKTAGGSVSTYNNSSSATAVQVSPAATAVKATQGAPHTNAAVNIGVLQKRTTVQDIRQASPQRRNFKTRAQSAGYEKQSFALPELKSYASYKRAEPLAFASLISLPDGGEDANGTYIVPKSVNMPCGLNSSKALEEGAMDKCLVGFIESSKRSQVTEAGDMLKIYHQGLKELTAAYIAEAYQAQINTSEFTDKILDSIDMAPTPAGLDLYGVLVEANKAVVGTMNGLLKMYSSRLALISYKKYGDYNFTSPDFEKE